MTDLELIFSMLGEASTTEIARNKNAQGFQQNKKASKEGGKIAGDARKALEKKSGKKVVSRQNFKELPEKEVRKLSSGKKESNDRPNHSSLQNHRKARRSPPATDEAA